MGGALLAVLSLIGRFLAFVGRGLVTLFRSSRVALVAFVVVVAVAGLGAYDHVSNLGRAYAGVTVGGLDVGGMTTEEITELIEASFGEQVSGVSVTIYASDEAAEAGEGEDNSAIAEQMTAEEEAASTTSWTVTADDLGASVPASKLAEEAVSVGRGDEGIVARIAAARSGRAIEVTIDYDEDAVEELAQTLDATLGTERVDYGIVVTDGVASVTEGSDGVMVDRDELVEQLDEAFLESEDGAGSFVAYAREAPVRVGEEAAQAVCDEVNAAIADGARFVCNDGVLDVSAADLGSWIVAEVEETSEGYALVAHVDESLAKPSVVAFAKDYYEGEDHAVSFSKDDDGEVTVTVEGSNSVPLASQAVEDLDEALFSDEATGEAPVITIAFGEVGDSMSFDEALDLGVIEAISSYTTTYSTGSGTENRNANIQLAASYLTDSICEPGGSWSFNDTCGERSSERGFLDAGAIVSGEYSTDTGGGICQVATTVFNAIYVAGYPITERHAHSLYISSYPTGRDAAVSWPDLDLVWENDTDSAVLVCVTCDTGSVTATLYGVDPGYEVTTETGEWEEGEEYSTTYEVDETLSSGTYYTETSGSDGRKITIVRTVCDEDGAVLHEDTFSSSYGAVDEVIVMGPDTVVDEEQ